MSVPTIFINKLQKLTNVENSHELDEKNTKKTNVDFCMCGSVQLVKRKQTGPSLVWRAFENRVAVLCFI